MKIVVIGGSGHIGSFLIPRLVRGGHDVINISRGTSAAYVDAPEWQQVRQVTADRHLEDREGTFGDRVAGLGADVVIDLVCFTLDSATALVNRLRGETGASAALRVDLALWCQSEVAHLRGVGLHRGAAG